MSAKTEANSAARGAVLAEEIEWQLKLGQGWWQAMKAVGYTNPQSLASRLRRAGRNDLAATFDTRRDQ